MTRRGRWAGGTATSCPHRGTLAKLGSAMPASFGPPGGTTAPEPGLPPPHRSADITQKLLAVHFGYGHVHTLGSPSIVTVLWTPA